MHPACGRRIRLVCDNARDHHTRAVHDWLDGHRRWIEVCRLPAYYPNLNPIDRLWGRPKRTLLANLHFASIADLVDAFQRGVRAVNAQRNEMGLVFDHDDVIRTRAARIFVKKR